MIAFSVQYGSFYYCIQMLACSLSFYIGSCWMFMAFVEDIKQEWNSTKALDHSKDDQMKLKWRINGFIEFHGTVKQWRKTQVFLGHKISVWFFFISQICLELYTHLWIGCYGIFFVVPFDNLWLSPDDSNGFGWAYFLIAFTQLHKTAGFSQLFFSVSLYFSNNMGLRSSWPNHWSPFFGHFIRFFCSRIWAKMYCINFTI